MHGEADGGVVTATAGGSVRDRAKARRRELQEERAFTIPLKGYEDMFAVYYRVLSYEEYREIGKRHDENTPDGELAVYADTLIMACLDILELDENGKETSTGQRWTPAAVDALFGVEELPADATARQAIRAVLPSNELALHFNDYDKGADKAGPLVERRLEGEFGAGSEPAPANSAAGLSPTTSP